MNLVHSRTSLTLLTVLLAVTLSLFGVFFLTEARPVEAASCVGYLYSTPCTDECFPIDWVTKCANGQYLSDCWNLTRFQYANGFRIGGTGWSTYNQCQYTYPACGYSTCS